mmetsp:Transcript_55002/g.170375  ORF Transcript_55002/g.170375 Transcript_55002/m.170375 type:complete len:254 (+) Transcript_55002:417-1178(+)
MSATEASALPAPRCSPISWHAAATSSAALMILSELPLDWVTWRIVCMTPALPFLEEPRSKNLMASWQSSMQSSSSPRLRWISAAAWRAMPSCAGRAPSLFQSRAQSLANVMAACGPEVANRALTAVIVAMHSASLSLISLKMWSASSMKRSESSCLSSSSELRSVEAMLCSALPSPFLSPAFLNSTTACLAAWVALSFSSSTTFSYGESLAFVRWASTAASCASPSCCASSRPWKAVMESLAHLSAAMGASGS